MIQKFRPFHGFCPNPHMERFQLGGDVHHPVLLTFSVQHLAEAIGHKISVKSQPTRKTCKAKSLKIIDEFWLLFVGIQKKTAFWKHRFPHFFQVAMHLLRGGWEA